MPTGGPGASCRAKIFVGSHACAGDLPELRGATGVRDVPHLQNVIAIGATGTGKSYVAATLAEAACRRGYRALRVRVPRLLGELAIAHADGSYHATLSRLAKLDLLVLDDLLIAPLKDGERRDLLEVLEDRYGRCSTVVTSGHSGARSWRRRSTRPMGEWWSSPIRSVPPFV